MKKLGYVVMLIGCVALLGVVGRDELYPGGELKAFVVKIALAAAVVLLGLFLSGVRHEDRAV